jgi:hypothetical protein
VKSKLEELYYVTWELKDHLPQLKRGYNGAELGEHARTTSDKPIESGLL